MILRPFGVRIVFFSLFLAAPCLAQDAPAPSPTPEPEVKLAPADSTPKAEPAPAPATATIAPAAVAPAAAESKAFPNHAGVGGLIGGSWFYAAEDYSEGSHPRFDFSGQFRYNLRPSWRLQVSPGFTWSAYSKKHSPPFTDPKFPEDTNKESYLTLLVPVSAQIQWIWGRSPRLYHVGAGPGVYRLWIENHRKVLADPATQRLHRGNYFGFTAEVGAEQFLKGLPKTSVEISMAQHHVMAERDDQFPSGWNSAARTIALRAGVNYYFDLNKPKETSELPPGLK
ncbi:MAG TPA: outer membrane beta-barrel protein [Candidatus Eisenbacteria bacterium]|nr:outer membrane beta-barrel protein [Candidatus Eisenbacteria bacterium]